MLPQPNPSATTPPTDDLPSHLETLLQHAEQVRILAAHLALDESEADDVIQETWLYALRHPPRHGANLRAWLGEVVRSAWRHGRRGERRRTARERAVADDPGRLGASEAADEAIGRAEVQRALLDHLLALDEPFRSTLVLRYLEGLPPREIAARQQVGVETVRSRVRRGLERLRGRLDAEHGARDAWLAVFGTAFGGPALRQAARASVLATSSTASTAWILMTTTTGKTLLATAAAVTLSLTGYLWFAARSDAAGSSSPREPHAGSRGAAPLAAAPAAAPAVARPGGAPVRTPAEARGEPERTTVTSPPETTPASDDRTIAGIVLDRLGRPVADVAVHWAGPHAVRWADSIDPWLNNGTDSLQVDDAMLQRLRRDSAYAEEVFARLEHPVEWRATLLGEVTPRHGAETGADGRFSFRLADDAPAAGRPIVIDPGYVLLGRGSCESASPQPQSILLVERSIRLTGRVVDPTGTPVADALVTLRCDTPPLPTLDPEVQWSHDLVLPSVETNAQGRFLLRDVPALTGALLTARHPERGRASLRVPTASSDALELVLDAPVFGPTSTRVEGRIEAPNGSPVAGAQLMFGSLQTESDTTGSFAFELPTDRPDTSLFVTGRGYQALTVENFGTTVEAISVAPEPVVLRFAAESLAIAGHIVDATGRPVGGAELNLFDPELPEITFSSLEMLSDGRRNVTTAADGSFRIGGLSAREYRLRIWRLEDRLVHVSEPLTAGTEGVLVELPDAPLLTQLSGRVVDSDDRPVAGARVSFGFETFRTRGDGTMNEEAPPVQTDAQGHFVLEDVPPRHVYLAVSSDGIARRKFAIEAVGAPSRPITLRVEALCRVRFEVPPDHFGDQLQVLDAAGRPLELVPLRGAQSATTQIRYDQDLGYPAVDLPASARSVVVFRGDERLTSLSIRPEPGRELRVRIP